MPKTHTEETKKKISATLSKTRTGKKHSEATKKKIGLAAIGRVWSAERRENIIKGKRRRRLSYIGGEEGIKNVFKMHKEGRTIYAIAKMYKTSVYNITRILEDEKEFS